MNSKMEIFIIDWTIKALDFLSYKGRDKEEYKQNLIKQRREIIEETTEYEGI